MNTDTESRYEADLVVRLRQYDTSDRLLSTSYLSQEQSSQVHLALAHLFAGRIIGQIANHDPSALIGGSQGPARPTEEREP